MLHFFVLVFGLFGELGSVGSDIPALDHEVGAAGDEHVVFAVVDVDHIQYDVLVLSNHQFLLHQLLMPALVASGYRRLDRQGLMAQHQRLEVGRSSIEVVEIYLFGLFCENC